MAKNLNDILSTRTKESQKRIHDMANEMLFEVKLQAIIDRIFSAKRIF